MRRAIACVRCRMMKRKCTTITVDGCIQCVRHSQPCSLSSRKAGCNPGGRLAPARPSSVFRIHFTADGTTVALTDAVAMNLVGNYLHLIHDRPHSLFHIATLWHDIREETISNHLLYSICSLGSSLSKDPELHALNKPLSLEAKRLLQADLENVTLENIQTLILLANICAAELSPSSETLYFGIANRMAHILKLHEPNATDDVVTRETKTRVWWTLFMADYWCSAGLGLPRQLYNISRAIELPIDEAAFQAARPHDTAIEASSGLWAYMLTLVEIFPLVQDLNRRLVDDDSLDDASADESALKISHRLDDWLASLPRRMRLNDRNFDEHATKGLGGAYVGLHLGYHHYATLLYFQYLDLQRPSTAVSKDFAERCKRHASSYSDLLRKSRETPGCEAVYATVGHMTVVSSSVLLHMLLFGKEDELEVTRALLNTNFIALIEMRNFWPSLERMITRLSAFQSACLQSADPNTHRIDRWMVRFLLEHSLPLDERDWTYAGQTGQHIESSTATRPIQGFVEREQFVSDAMATLRE
ncbi:hypothetical protein M409DRAFT_67944 [Zasmidium cellare ATCC 36951]|uniref:Zn(2)-C6 fungal-type domain-containing protein n=1 Tax=Zasmidium cellare ATCC 36951 TaxID=1080233 RepID=A0A6A6CEQ7_ZASCE|nr:uncharacterized protein M409DRAFT_67944 [Zasmidium cellare ATCC 36951]KAF2164412.1 hypothetical protein M409DRAFT_67944 [Zasmidium cellare ATCC 36951]